MPDEGSESRSVSVELIGRLFAFFAMAQNKSPLTNRFYCISKLMKKQNEEYRDSRNRIVSLTGIMG
jgi:hypothetical protein